MNLPDLLEEGAKVALAEGRAWLAKAGVTITDELLADAWKALAKLLKQGPGVTHAERLVIEDERSNHKENAK